MFWGSREISCAFFLDGNTIGPEAPADHFHLDLRLDPGSYSGDPAAHRLRTARQPSAQLGGSLHDQDVFGHQLVRLWAEV